MEKILIEEELCVAAGQCVISAPGVFDQDDNGIAILIDDNPPDSERDNVEAAIATCPARALRFGK